jgi:hypothetical protein
MTSQMIVNLSLQSLLKIFVVVSVSGIGILRLGLGIYTSLLAASVGVSVTNQQFVRTQLVPLWSQTVLPTHQ